MLIKDTIVRVLNEFGGIDASPVSAATLIDTVEARTGAKRHSVRARISEMFTNFELIRGSSGYRLT